MGGWYFSSSPGRATLDRSLSSQRLLSAVNMKWGDGMWARVLKPHDSRIEFLSGLSWVPPPLFWLALDLEGVLF